MARGAELAGIALGTEHGEQILKGISEALAVVVAELIDDLEEGAESMACWRPRGLGRADGGGSGSRI